jgi:hypothetical protein
MANSNPKQTKQFRDSQGRFARVSKETARKAGRKGAAVSNQVQAEKRTMKEVLTSLLDVKLEPDKVRQRIINLGYPPEIAENVTPRLMIALGFINRCMGKGDPNAIKLMLEVIGEYVETIRHELPTDKGELVLAPKKKD